MASIRWFGHSGFEIIADKKVILVDPFLTGNLKAAIKASDITRADIVCVTHDHGDHLGDAIDVCKRTGATFVGVYELGNYVQAQGVTDVVAMNVGATLEVKGIKITMVQAFHSAERGSPVGFVFDVGKARIYHAGDTGLFSDMRMIGQIYRPDIACLPIGGYYTMGAREAAEAVRLLLPKIVFPMHYLTFPVLAQSADDFVNAIKEKGLGTQVVVLKPGESYNF
ncbi:MAG: metal-dependent hydrolase [Hadesarchaea archaeon]|nr:metal-dependent hydrolase [Hadesarchaea archaeon]